MTESDQHVTLSSCGLEFSARLLGPIDGPTVVCLHGFPDSAETFRLQTRALTEAGYRVLVPTLRGYEPSSSADDYSLLTVADDVVTWIDQLGVDRAHVVGHDWGAVIAYVVAAHHPERVRSLTALAIPPLWRIPAAVRSVPRQLVRSWYMTFFQVPTVSDRALRWNDWWLLRRLWRVWSPAYDMTEEDWEPLRTQFARPGVVAASLAYYRHNATPPILLGLRTTPAMSATTIRSPALIVHGADDGCMDRRLFVAAIRPDDFTAGVDRVEVADAGHFVHLESPELVNTAVLGHLANADRIR